MSPGWLPERDERRRGQRPGEQVSLSGIAADRGELLALSIGFDAFRDNQHAQGVRHPGHGGDDLPVAGLPGELRDEAAIDLQAVGAEIAQMDEGRVTGPEVVERDPDTYLRQPDDRAMGVAKLREEDAYRGW